MNATLQCLCHIEKFVNYFKYKEKVKEITKKDKNNLTYSFKLLIENLWPDDYEDTYFDKKAYAPEEFKTKLAKMNPLFEKIFGYDAKDLVNFLIMTLHEELNNQEKKNINNNNCIIIKLLFN